MEKVKDFSNEKKLKFKGIDEVYFPKNCMICGEETENRIENTNLGSFTSTKEYKKDYKIKLPVCNRCDENINLKAGKNGVILFMGFILGISLGILIFYLTYTILLSIAVFIVLVTFPYLSYRTKIKPRIKLSDFMQMKVIPNEELVLFSFKDKQYANYVYTINQDHLKEKEKTENIKEEIPKTSERKEDLPSKTGTSQIEEDFSNIKEFPNKDIYAPKVVNDVNIINPQTKLCPKCGHELKPGWKFCVSCSEPINFNK